MGVSYALAFAAMFAHVMARAFQQLNVTLHRPRWVMPTSFVMAATEVFVIATVAVKGWGWIVLPIALGGGLGCLSAMWLHAKMRTG